MDQPDESTGQILIDVFMCVLRPIGQRIAASWDRAGLNPLKLLVAFVATVAWVVVALVYAVAALVVPLTYALLLTITAPIVVGALLQRRRAGRNSADG